ncbi:unnamed protein product [Allacma fusca]|uniref:Protein quiver n=1 Tax=Allacma fusca TaxID=39272 RepID=A0A8J2J8C2_9HEXA|nr:unnamed protein product [Allacma fusca]
MHGIIHIQKFFFLSSILTTTVHSRPHADIPDVTLECYSCIAGEHEKDKVTLDRCTDPVTSGGTVVKCINQLCMRLSGHSTLLGHRIQRGCGDDTVTVPGCKDLESTGEPEETQRYVCYCAQDRCNAEPGLVVERAEVMEIQVEGGGGDDKKGTNAASSFHLMREEINGALYSTPTLGLLTLSWYLKTHMSP